MTDVEEPLPVALRRTHDALRQLNRECDCDEQWFTPKSETTCERCVETVAAMGQLEAAATRIESDAKCAAVQQEWWEGHVVRPTTGRNG